MWQTMTEDIDAISIGLRRRLTLPDGPLGPPIVRPLAHVRMKRAQLNVRFWPIADIPSCTAHVAFRSRAESRPPTKLRRLHCSSQ